MRGNIVVVGRENTTQSQQGHVEREVGVEVKNDGNFHGEGRLLSTQKTCASFKTPDSHP